MVFLDKVNNKATALRIETDWILTLKAAGAGQKPRPRPRWPARHDRLPRPTAGTGGPGPLARLAPCPIEICGRKLQSAAS